MYSMRTCHTAIIGGGAAGITAAISAERSGADALICERMPHLGKKILASGGGRCNLLNDDLNESHYNPSSRNLVKETFRKFGKERILDFFDKLGLVVYSEEGRIFPVTNQAASVMRVMEIELERLRVPVEYNFEAFAIQSSDGLFTVTAKDNRRITCKKIVIAGGGKSYPALGSDGSCYRLAAKLGHGIVEPVPSCVPLVVKDGICHLLQGQKIYAKTRCIINGKTACEASGDFLFTKYGLSGTAILDISEDVSIAINRHRTKDATVSADIVPFLEHGELSRRLKERMDKGVAAEDLLAGILPNKFKVLSRDLIRLKSKDKMAASLKDMRFEVSGTRGWNEAEFTAGGIDISEVNRETLESNLQRGVYFAGEILDVQGKRGGYNLAWAWASGFLAGQS